MGNILVEQLPSEKRISGFQDFRISGFQDFRISGVQDFRISGFQEKEAGAYSRLSFAVLVTPSA